MATLVPAILGANYGISADNISNILPYLQDFGIRAASFLPALPVGMMAMSALTFPKKSEVSRIVVERGRLSDVSNFLGR